MVDETDVGLPSLISPLVDFGGTKSSTVIREGRVRGAARGGRVQRRRGRRRVVWTLCRGLLNELALARLVKPASKLDSLRVLGDAGIAAVWKPR